MISVLYVLNYSLIFPGVRLGADSQFSDFLDGLGPAQLVGRQTLATPAMGKKRFVVKLKPQDTPTAILGCSSVHKLHSSKINPLTYLSSV